MRVFIGHDERESLAWHVAATSLQRRASKPVEIVPLMEHKLRLSGMLRRPVDSRGSGMYDLTSQSAQSTQFANARFFVPLLAHSGWALFVDCDVVFLSDVYELESLRDPTKAVQVVQHDHKPVERFKMVDQAQAAYSRKNWSSVVLWNLDHPGHRRLTLDILNGWPGRDLHAFGWLADGEIGTLPPEWNWLVGVQPKPALPRVAHFTLGGPWLPGWQPSTHDDLWQRELQEASE